MNTVQWWQQSVFYQVYPRSFQDSNNDGIGDLKGVTSRLDYLSQLGIDAIWLSPVYASPNADNGYDISNYYEIMPEFGTMADLEELIAEAKKRQIKIIMDLVINHTSDEHPWFIEAKKGNPTYQDYYIFRKGMQGAPPNQLTSFFGGSAWTYLPDVQNYYLHLFADKQPDLNWENAAMRKEIWAMMRFWLEKGIGGFRLDVIDLIGKQPEQGILGNGPMLHPYLQEMHEQVLKNYDVVTIGETGSVTPETAPLYTQPERKELSMVFQFQHMALDEQPHQSKWALKDLAVSELKETLSRWQTELPKDAWNSLFWSNHDQPRILSRWGNPENYPLESGKMLAILLHLMRGTPFIYQGEEIGMTNQRVSTIEELADIESIHFYQEQQQAGISETTILTAINTKGRDNARTPMQWDETRYSGFSKQTPWYPVNPNYPDINVAQNLTEPTSLFYTYQHLIRLRKTEPIIVWGDYQLLETAATIFAYQREYQGQRWLICGNFSDQPAQISLTQRPQKTIISNYEREYQTLTDLTLAPYETFAVELF